MPQKVRIALDAMGGDVGASVVIPGAADFVVPTSRHRISAVRRPRVDRTATRQASGDEGGLARHSHRRRRQHERQAEPGACAAAARPRRCGWRSTPSRRGEADVAVSAGNTGALMAMARFCLRMLPGIDRPAIAAVWPTMRGDSVVLDLGATIGGDAQHLVALAVMGSAMASVLFDLERPTVGLLNIGVEEIKGREEIREAAELLRAMNLPQLEYHRLRRGRRHRQGRRRRHRHRGVQRQHRAEGRRRHGAADRRIPARGDVAHLALEDRLSVRPRTPSRRCATRWIPNKSNGGVLLGLNGIVVKSHGGTDAEGFAYAVDVGYEMVHYDLLTKINQMLNREGSALGADRAGGCLVTAIRSVVLGCGSYLPQQILTNAELAAQGRHLRRVDRAAHRHPAAPYRRRRRVHLASGDQCRARRARQCRDRCAVDRPDRAGDLDAGQYLSRHRGCGAERARHQPRRGVRPAGGMLRISSSRWPPPTISCAPARSSARW